MHTLPGRVMLTYWSQSLQPFKYDVDVRCHRDRAQHKNADGLSRGPPDPWSAMVIQMSVTKQLKMQA